MSRPQTRAVEQVQRFVAPLPQTPHPSVARIIVPERGAVSYGSGTLVDTRGKYGLVITNWHVVRDASEKVEVVFPDGFRSFARPLKIDSDWDLAALVIWQPTAKPVRLATSAPQRGDVLTIAGYGTGRYRAMTGRCTQYVAPGLNFPHEMVEVSVQARQGDSGGPIFNEQGELAGVLFGAGHGNTIGSYAGRVRGFLASIVPDVDSRSGSMIAVAPRQSTARQSESVDGGVRHDRQTQLAANPPRRPTRAAQSSPPAGPATAALGSRAADDRPLPVSLGWRDLAGETWPAQAKTVLALIGALAVMVFVLRRA